MGRRGGSQITDHLAGRVRVRVDLREPLTPPPRPSYVSILTNVGGGGAVGEGRHINSGRSLLPELVLLRKRLLVLVELRPGLDLGLDLLGQLLDFFFRERLLLFDLSDLRG